MSVAPSGRDEEGRKPVPFDDEFRGALGELEDYLVDMPDERLAELALPFAHRRMLREAFARHGRKKRRACGLPRRVVAHDQRFIAVISRRRRAGR